MTISSIFASALRTAIGDETRIFDYGDKNTFVDLWTMDKKGYPRAFSTGDGSGREEDAAGSGSSVSNEKQSAGEGRSTPGDTIVIVWDEDGGDWDEDGDDRAPSESDEWTELLKPHLTPMDWALAFSIKILAQDKVPECADVAIHIVDLTGRDHTTWSMRMRHQLLAEMPWVTLYAPLIPEGAYRSGYRPILDGSGSLPNNGGMDSTLRAGTATLKACASRGYGRNLAGLSRQWASTLVQTHDHHDLNNLVGPWILSEIGTRTHTSAPPLFRAFWNRLHWTGLIPEETPLYDLGTAPLSDIGTLDVVALDDRLDDGWNHVICRLFGAVPENPTSASGFQPIGSNGGIELYGSKDARKLLASLKEPCAFKERQFDSPIRCSDNKQPWLLVLDLLLFSRGSSDERDWLTELLCIANGASEASPRLAWPGFTEAELEDVRNWLPSGNVEDPAYNTALSLLPRLCALRWPSVPIILFSGTSRRELTDKLSVYRNIFLAPQKPNLLSGNMAEETNAFFGGWRRELDRAKGLIVLQGKLLSLWAAGESELTRADKARTGGTTEIQFFGSTNPQPSESHPATGPVHRHLTIAFDESGNFNKDDFSAIGGVIIETRSTDNDSAKNLTFKFLEELRAEGINFYDHPPIYTEVQTNNSNFRVGRTKDQRQHCYGVIPKGSDISCHLTRTLQLQPYERNVSVGTFRCLIGRTYYQQYGSTDGIYLEWLARCIELILCEHLPSLGYDMSNNLSLSIWIPTRATKNTAARMYSINSEDLLGVGDGLIQTVGGHSVAYQIVLRALTGRPGSHKIIENCNLKLRKIPYFDTEKPDQSYESALHWLCPRCKTMKGPYLSKPRLIPQNQNRPEMTEAQFDTRRREYVRYSAGGVRYVGEENGRHVSCGGCNGKYMPADYSVAQHLADAAIKNNPDCFPHTEIGKEEICPEISFDVEVGTRLEDFLETGRCFDQEQFTEGFMIAFGHDFFVTGLNRDESEIAEAKIHSRIVHRLRKYSTSIDGDTLLRLAASQSAQAPGTGSTA